MTTVVPAAGGTDAAVDVSVVIPVHNVETWLDECLVSVQSQSGVSLQIVCVDDGSSDRSPAILKEHAEDDGRILVLTQENAGASVARNAGIRAATGRYVCFLDSDDYWRLDGLGTLVRRADADGLDVLLFDAQAFVEPGVDKELWKKYEHAYTRSGSYTSVLTGPEMLAAMGAELDYQPSACLGLMRRQFLLDAALSFHPGILYEDNLFTFALHLAAERVGHEDLPLYARRVRAGSIISSVDDSALQSLVTNLAEMMSLLEGRQYDPSIATQIGRVVGSVWWSARRACAQVPPWKRRELSLSSASAVEQAYFQMLINYSA